MSYLVSTYLPSYGADILQDDILFRKCAQATVPFQKVVDKLAAYFSQSSSDNYVRFSPFVTYSDEWCSWQLGLHALLARSYPVDSLKIVSGVLEDRSDYSSLIFK